MKRAHEILLLLLPCAVWLGGCAARPPELRELYAGLRESPESLDASALAGRRIVIDPGHGGAAKGVVGIDSLREADANLGVALYLWGLCKDAGADVHLTRTADRDFLPPDSNNLRDDLQARIDKANEIDPDVFISIHHNSNLALKRDMNKIEVYYRSDDPGASLELAQDIEMHLARNLGIDRSEVRPGNYFVLRLSEARASVLGEASYLSHPTVENRLKLAEKQKLEAEAYFFGLISYFSRGVPAIERLSPKRDTLASPAEISFRVRGSRGVPIDPASLRITIGGSETVPSFDAVRSVIRSVMDPALPNGSYAVRASARSTGGATSVNKPYALFLNRPALHILALGAERKPDSIASLSVKVLDELGAPVADGTRVAAVDTKRGTRYAGECKGGTFTIETPIEFAHAPFIFKAGDATDTIRFAIVDSDRLAAVLVKDARTGRPVPDAQLVLNDSPGVSGDGEGRAIIPLGASAETLLVHAQGYGPTVVDSIAQRASLGTLHIELEPLLGGALTGRKIALDPGGGGSDPGGVGPNRVRGAAVNLEVAKHLRDILTKAGAGVVLTRSGDETVSSQERADLVNRYGAELAIGIRHGPMPDETGGTGRTIRHYPGSTGGALVSRRLAAALANLPPPDVFAVRESDATFLTHTSCTACEVYCGSVENAALEALMSSEPWVRVEAEKMCAAIASYFSPERPAPGEARIRAMVQGMPASGATIDIDHLFIESADADGMALFSCVTPGWHLITVETADGRARQFMKKITERDTGEVALEIR